LLDLDTGGEIALIEHPANDLLFGWAPDGGRVLFRSDRTSRYGLWVINIDEGMPQGPPSLLKNNFDGRAIGFTPDGSYYYSVDTTASNVFIGTLDSTGTQFESEPTLASSRYVGSATMGDFLPDGTLLAYRASAPELRVQRYNRGNWILVVNSVQTGDERIIAPSPAFRPETRMWGPRWSPDGRSLLVIGASEETGYGLHTVDVQTGEAKVLRQSKGRLHEAAWSPDGTSIFFSAKESGSQVSLRKLDTVTGQETEFYSGGSGTLDISPDGLWLAFGRNGYSIVVMPSAGGELREVLARDPEPSSRHHSRFVRWTPDGEHLIYDDNQGQLWKIHTETGRRQRLGPAIENLVDVAVHPDGRQIAFTVEQTGSELWIMKDVLPD
jgi:Tol biopolymer transport system component